ncbi:MAG TPA: caspase family protein [Reyranella sp.]|nr:caspase family protein [Reyranella sp.]
MNRRHLVIGRRGVLAGTGMLAMPAIVRAQARASGVAMVIGNSKYEWEAQLPNVKRDAPDIVKRFQDLGLKTEYVENATQAALKDAVARFAAAAKGAPLAAFYFAGHGVKEGFNSYLVPVDCDLSDPSVVKTLTSVPSINAVAKNAAHTLEIFDNCRNNPADGWKQVETDRMAVSTVESQVALGGKLPNLISLFSTCPGRTALDGPAGQNSPFCAALLRHLSGPSVDIAQLPAKLRRDLLLATDGQQVVYDYNTYTQPFSIKGAGAASGGAPVPATQVIELPQAYAFAQQNDLVMPPGLVAIRGAADGRKTGAFRYQTKSQGPAMFIVLSVNEKGVANVILVGKDAKSHYWRLTSGNLKGDKLVFQPSAKSGLYTYTWRDANTGTLENTFAKTRIDMPFTRLDG